jgi:hypothetical protein
MFAATSQPQIERSTYPHDSLSSRRPLIRLLQNEKPGSAGREAQHHAATLVDGI